MKASANLTIERFEIGEGEYVWTIFENSGAWMKRLGQARSEGQVMQILTAFMDRLDQENDEIFNDLHD